MQCVFFYVNWRGRLRGPGVRERGRRERKDVTVKVGIVDIGINFSEIPNPVLK